MSAKISKIIVLGDSGVGKSCLIERYCGGRYNPKIKPTVGAEFSTKVVPLSDGSAVVLQLWDTAGQERYRSLGTGYWRGSVGCALVCDMTCRASFAGIKFWQEQYASHSVGPAVYVLIAAKTDVPAAQQVVTTTELEAWAAVHKMPVYLVSAKANDNVSGPFEYLAEQVGLAAQQGGDDSASSSGQPTPVTKFLANNDRYEEDLRNTQTGYSCNLCFT